MCDRGGGWIKLEAPGSSVGANIFKGKAAELLNDWLKETRKYLSVFGSRKSIIV
jgi:hypothetical protein